MPRFAMCTLNFIFSAVSFFTPLLPDKKSTYQSIYFYYTAKSAFLQRK